MLSWKPPGVLTALDWLVGIARAERLVWEEIEQLLLAMMEESESSYWAARLVLTWTYSMSGLLSHFGEIQPLPILGDIAEDIPDREYG